MADLPNQKTLNDVVEQLQELNAQTEMAQETARYTQELRDYMENEGANLDTSQLSAIEELIQVLKEGRLDDLEAEKEAMLRQRIEARRDAERNDLLEKISKFTGENVETLKAEFGDKKRGVILGIIIRTAIRGLFLGFLAGAFLEPFKLLGKGLVAISSKIGRVLGLDKFFGNLRVGLQTNISKAFQFFGNIFKSKPGQPPGFLSKTVTGLKTVLIDVFTLVRTTVGNILKVVAAATGFFAGRFGALESLTKLNFRPEMISKPFIAIGNLLERFFKPLSAFTNLFSTEQSRIVKSLDAAGKSLNSSSKVVTSLGTSIFNFFKNLQPIQTAFKFLGRVGKAFMGIGKVFGRFFVVINGLFAAVRGFREGFNKFEDGSFLTNIFAGVTGAVSGVLQAIYGVPLDFVKKLVSWLASFLGFEGVAGFLDSFSFSDLIKKSFDFVTEGIVNFFAKLSDEINDIGFGGIIKNIGINLLKVFKKIALFPSAIAAGGLGALAAAVPGGKTPMEGFKENFNKVFSAGDDMLESLKAKADGMTSDGQLINAKSEEGKALRDAAISGPRITEEELARRSTILYDIQQKGGDMVNVVTTAAKDAVSTVGGVISNTYS